MKAIAKVLGIRTGNAVLVEDPEDLKENPKSLLEIAGVRSGDGTRPHESYSVWKEVIPIPPQSLILTTGSTSLEAWYVVAEAWAQTVLRYLARPGRVLDIGCGKASRA